MQQTGSLLQVVQTARLNILDELYLHLNREDEPWSVQLEIRVEGTIDRARLADAVRSAALRHPIARARLAPSRFTDVRDGWEIADDLPTVPLEVVESDGADDVDRAREELLGRTPPLDSPGPFALLLAHQPGGDALILNLHHAAGDGLAALRLMGSIARAYGGEGDPLPAVDPLEVRDIRALARAVTVRRWSEEHGERTCAVYLTMPINLRPPDWRFEVVGNFASYVSVRVGESDHESLGKAIESAAASTRRIKEGGVAGLLVELFDAPTLLPTGVKQRLQELIPLTGNLAVDTAVLSNLGRIDEVPELGDAGRVREVWFSPPGRMPLGASLGAVTLDGRLFMTLRYRHALFDGDAAARFLETYRGVLAG